jgi:hypothetical protein
MRRAKELRRQGKGDEADAILKGLWELYGDGPAARAGLEGE